MKRLLFVCTRPPGSRFRNGGTAVTEANHKALSGFAELTCFSTLPEAEGRLASLWRRLGYFAGRFGGFTPARLRSLFAEVERSKPEAVFLDHSQLAAFGAGLARRFPELPLYVQFHNYEANYVPMGGLPLKRRLRRLLQANDFLAMSCARGVTLVSKEDLDCLRRDGAPERPSAIIPISVPKPLFRAQAPRQDHFVFFGANSPHNRESLAFVIEQLVPRLPAPLWVVGTGMASLRLPTSERVLMKGAIEHYEACLASSIALLCPCFSGSGMNVKLADAMRCGLPVITNRFGARGFPTPYPAGLTVVDEVADMIHHAERLRGALLVPDEMQSYFLRHFSVEARRAALQRLLSA